MREEFKKKLKGTIILREVCETGLRPGLGFEPTNV